MPVPLLWEAMQTVDPETGRSRGYLIVAKGLVSESLLFTIDKARHREFAQLAHWLQEAAARLPPLMADAVLQHGSGPDGGVDHARLLPVFLESLPTAVATMVTTFHSTLCVNYTERHLRSIDHVRGTRWWWWWWWWGVRALAISLELNQQKSSLTEPN